MILHERKRMSETFAEQMARTDLQLVVELSEHDSDCLSAGGVYVVGNVTLLTLMSCQGLSSKRAIEIYDAVNVFVERMPRT